MLRQTLLSCAFLALGSVAALAADVPAADHSWDHMATAATPMVWSGLYLGGGAAGVWGDSRLVFANGNPAPTIGTSGWLGGGILGYQLQNGNWVYGVEGKLLGAGISGSNVCFNASYTCRVDNVSPIATLGVRAGYAWDRWLLYGSLAYAGGDITTHTFVTATGAEQDTTTAWHNGFELGAGIDYAVHPQLIVGLEYMYIDLGSALHTSAFAPGNPAYDLSADAKISTLMARVTWKFK